MIHPEAGRAGDNNANLRAKRSWDTALAPIKQAPMNLFIMYMSGKLNGSLAFPCSAYVILHPAPSCLGLIVDFLVSPSSTWRCVVLFDFFLHASHVSWSFSCASPITIITHVTSCVMLTSGNTISIFPIMMVVMMAVRPFKTLLSMGTTFKTLDSDTGATSALGQKGCCSIVTLAEEGRLFNTGCSFW